MNNIEKYYIYGETKNGTKINDNSTVSGNRIFDIVIKLDNTDGIQFLLLV